MSAPITCLSIVDVAERVKAATYSEEASPVAVTVNGFKALLDIEANEEGLDGLSDDDLKLYFECALAISTHGFSSQEGLPAKATGVFADLIKSKGIEFFRPPAKA